MIECMEKGKSAWELARDGGQARTACPMGSAAVGPSHLVLFSSPEQWQQPELLWMGCHTWHWEELNPLTCG